MNIKIEKGDKMSLSDVAMGKKVSIKNINADSVLKKRLRALGVSKNSEAIVLEESLGKQNMKISIGSTEVALRKNEAELIEVEVLP